MLLIDADPQGSLTASLGYVEPDELQDSLATVLEAVIDEEEFEAEKGILHHDEGVDVLPGNIELSAIEVAMTSIMSRKVMMREYLERVKEKYDYILMDCMPSLGMMTVNALVAADAVLIPVQAAYLPVKGLQQLIKTINMVKKRLNKKLCVEGILLTMVDCRTNFTKDIAATVHQLYESIGVFEVAIPSFIKAVETSAVGASVYQHCPNVKVAKAYTELTREVLDHER